MLRLKVYDGQDKVREIALGTEVVSIGREPGNTLLLPDASVSRRHARIEPNGNLHVIRDTGSTNGTFVNETLVRLQLLNHGDVIRVESAAKKKNESTRVRVDPLCFPAAAGDPIAGPDPTVPMSSRDESYLGNASRSRLLRLHEIQSEVARIDTIPALLDRALEIVLLELQATRGSILLCEPSPRGPEGETGVQFSPAAVRSMLLESDAGEEIVIPEGLLLEAVTKAQGLVRQMEGPSPRSCIVAPLRDHGMVRGIVYMERGETLPGFALEELRFLAAIANEVAISLANAQLFEEVSGEKEKLQAVFTSLTDGIIVAERDFTVVDANAATSVLLGLGDRNPLGCSLFDLLSGFELSPTQEVLRASSQREGALFHLKRSLQGETQGGVEYISGSVVPYPRRAEQPKGRIVTLRDRSEVHRFEELKTQFIGNVSHKLRTPLTVIEGNLPLLRHDHGEKEQILADMERNSHALCLIVDEFVDFVELELRSPRLKAVPEPVRLKSLVREAVRSVAREAQAKGILVVERLREDVPSVLGRPGQLLKACQCILENAVKFSAQGGQVVVEAEEQDGYIRIDFSDDGPGIPREQIESVFYVCHQVDQEKTGQIPGAGLGLAVARRIIQEHGGEIRILSPYRFEEHGTNVSIILPLKPAEQASSGKPGAFQTACQAAT